MQQADRNITEAPASPLIFPTSGETLSRCADMIRFIGAAVSAIQSGGGGMNRGDADAACMLADMAADAIEWESSKLSPALPSA